MIGIYLIIMAIVALLTYIAIKLLPNIDKNFEFEVSLFEDYYCELEDIDLKIINPIQFN